MMYKKQFLRKSYIVTILTILLMTNSSGTLYASDTISPQESTTVSKDSLDDVVYNEEQLAAWCERHHDKGGRVILGADVTLTGNYYFARSSDSKLIIDTKRHGLIYDGSHLSGDFEITGEGKDTPVLTVTDPNIFRSSWIHSIQDLHVTATGRKEDNTLVGGTAVYIKDGNNDYAPNMEFIMTEGRISSYGKSAVGLKINENIGTPLDIYCLNIKTDGTGSTVVDAPAGANLYYCKLNPSGQSSSVTTSKNTTFDTCSFLNDLPLSSTVINRNIVDISGSRLYLPVPQNETDTENLLGSYNNANFILSGEGTPPPSLLTVKWDDDAFHTIDYDKLCRTVI